MVDFFILTFCCLSYFTNYLDRSNLANAYVSGMKEELDFQGNQLNLINTVFTVGYVFLFVFILWTFAALVSDEEDT